ncbi:YciI family protein [Agromyces tropicus]|uniref:YciI family protein n=1 Tax=Agromyces tropicus TaxID=555371 RepID=A0ABN2UFQ5_9MICO
MKYLILIKSNPEWQAAWRSFTPEQLTASMAIYTGLVRDLQESGELVDAEQLADPETVRTVTVGDHGPVASDAPLPETKEFLSGYYLVDVASFDRALEIGARLPEAQWGGIVITPILAQDAAADASVA